MKLASVFNLATGALVASSAIPGRKVDTASTQLQHANPLELADQSPELAKRRLVRRDQGCRARVMETFNQGAIYTVANSNTDFCSRWVNEVTNKCPDMRTLQPPERSDDAFTIPHDVLVSSAESKLAGWVSAEGATNKSSVACTVTKFNEGIRDFKIDERNRIIYGVLIGAAVCVGAYGTARAFCEFGPTRRRQNADPAIPLSDLQ